MQSLDDRFTRQLICNVRFALTERYASEAALLILDKIVFQRGDYTVIFPIHSVKFMSVFSLLFLTKTLVKHPDNHCTRLLWVFIT